VIFVDFRLMKNIILNKTESIVGRNTCDLSNILFSKSNCETMHHWFFLLGITMVKIMNNLNVCSAHSYLYPPYRCKWILYQLTILNAILSILKNKRWTPEISRHKIEMRMFFCQMYLIMVQWVKIKYLLSNMERHLGHKG